RRPSRAYYERLTSRGMRPAKAMGHVAGKLSAVLYSMLKTMTPYDEAKHRRALGLAPVQDTVIEATVEAPLDVVELTIEHMEFLDEADDGEDIGRQADRSAPKLA